MTKEEFHKIKPGDIVRKKFAGTTILLLVLSNYDGLMLATIALSNGIFGFRMPLFDFDAKDTQIFWSQP